MIRKHFFLWFITLILAIYFLLPILLSPKIEQLIKASSKAEIQLNQLSLNTISSFPRWKIKVNELETQNHQNAILAKRVTIEINPWNIFRDTIKVDQISIDTLNILRNPKSENIISNQHKKETSKTAQKVIKASDFAIYSFNYKLNDHQNRLHFDVKNAQISGKRDDSKITIDFAYKNIVLAYDSLRYVNSSNKQISAQLNNNDFNKYSIVDHSVRFNNNEFDLSGDFEFNQFLTVNLKFSKNHLSLKEILQGREYLKKYLSYIENGNFNLNGNMNGTFAPNQLPLFQYTMQIDSLELKDSLQFKNQVKIPKASIIAELSAPNIDSMHIYVNKTKLITNDKIANLQFDIQNAFSNPFIKTSINGQVDLATLAIFLPQLPLTYSGSLDVNAEIQGEYENLKHNNYEKFISKGSIETSQIAINHNTWYYPLKVQKSKLLLKGNQLQINHFSAKYGESELNFTGTIFNPIDYLFKDQDLKGDFFLKSDFLNLNQILAKKTSEAKPTNTNKVITTTSPNKKLPKRLAITIHTNAKKALFDRMNIANFEGDLKLNPAQLTLSNCNAQLLDGKLFIDGKINANATEKLFVGNLKLQKIDFRKSYDQLRLIQKTLPLAKYSSGKFSANFFFETPLDEQWQINTQKAKSSGTIATHSIIVQNNPSLRSLSSVIKMNRFKTIPIDDFEATYTYENEILTLNPFETKLANQPVKMFGTYETSTSGTIDFKIDAKVDKAILADKIQDMIKYIPGNERLKVIDVGLSVTGDASKPKIEIDYDKIKKQVLQQIKTSSPKELEDAAKNLLRQLFK